MVELHIVYTSYYLTKGRDKQALNVLLESRFRLIFTFNNLLAEETLDLVYCLTWQTGLQLAKLASGSALSWKDWS